MREKTRSWFEHARLDLAAAIYLVGDGRFGNIVAYHCQQCAEKSLKALLEEKSAAIPRSHSIIHLLQPVHEHYPAFTPGIDELELAVLDDIYTDSRYPGSKGMLPTGVPTHDEARQFIRLAETLLGAAEKTVA